MTKLWPPLRAIEARLTPEVQVTADTDLCVDGLTVPDKDVGMPDAIRSAIGRTVAAQELAKIKPRVGSIVLLSSIAHQDGAIVQELPTPIAICLEAQKRRSGTGSEWIGWVASPDVDYATDLDVLLEPGDEPFDPLAGMVQVWNPVSVWVPNDARVIAQLSEYRLSVIQEVARDGPDSKSRPSPGRVALRATGSGRAVLTGTRLSEDDDDRAAYRLIYTRVAKAFGASAEAQLQRVAARRDVGAASLASRIVGWVSQHRFPLAGAIATVSTVAITAYVMLQESPSPEQTQVAQVDKVQPKPPKTESENGMAVVTEPPKLPSDSSTSGRTAQKTTPEHNPGGREASQAQLASNGSRESADTRQVTRQESQERDGAQNPITDLASSFLLPLRDEAIVLAMRGGAKGLEDMVSSQIKLKDKRKVGEAISVLSTLGMKIARVDDKTGTLIVVMPRKTLSPDLDDKLLASGLFVAVQTERAKK
jgi:hypothetical protein